LGFGMKRRGCIEDCQSPIGRAGEIPFLADVAKHLPFVRTRAGRDIPRSCLTCNHAKRHRSPPKGRRYEMRLHFSLTLFQAKEIRSPKRRDGAKKTLDDDSRKCDSLATTLREGLPGYCFGGLFLDRKSTRLNSSHVKISY